MQPPDTLIHTKLRLPSTRASLVPRPRLAEQLAAGLRLPLTLIIAPAGSGKTTLAADFARDCGIPAAWLALDKDDNQAGRFLRYMAAALHQAVPAVGADAERMLAVSGQAPSEAVLTSLVNDLDDCSWEVALILDDYQFISSQAAHDQTAFLLEHCPERLHLLIASRSDPPLPLARLRARGLIAEVRGADLSFSASEAAVFLNHVMGLHLDEASVGVLNERTEGWAAGLQMAALSMHDRHDIPAFIQAFSGTNRYILDYLLEEVLAGQPQEIQDFLLHTSILERLCAPLCDAVLADLDPQPSRESASIMDHLDRSNIFLVTLDDERRWYRYHHLFADLLHAQLQKSEGEQAVKRLHLRAAAWYEGSGMIVEAINHSLSAGEYDRAAQLVEGNTTRLLAQGELNSLMSWVEMLPVEVRMARPWLCVHQAYALIFAGRTAEVAPLLEQAEAACGDDEQNGSDTPSLRGAMSAVRTFTAAILDNPREVLSLAGPARKLLVPGDLFNQSLITWAVGYAHHKQGDLRAARAAFEEHVRLARAMQNDAMLMIGLTALARVLGAEGQLRTARALLEQALSDARQNGARNPGFIARLEAHLAGVLCEQNELEAAHRLLSDALNLARFWLNANHIAFIQVFLARVLLARADFQGARDAIGEAMRQSRSAELSPWLGSSLDTEIVRVWLALQNAGTGSPAEPLAERSGLILASWRRKLGDDAEHPGQSPDQSTEMERLTLARICIASGQTQEALRLLRHAAQSAQAQGHVELRIHCLVQTAMALQGDEAQSAAALAAIGEALNLAGPGGYMRIFLDEGPPMRKLLARWQARAEPGFVRDYAACLLAQFDAETHEAGVNSAAESPTGSLIEPLSRRELEVLQLMALGSTNQQIAGQLVVAAGTVKAHTASIYRKLEVANRTEAVARARKLGILV